MTLENNYLADRIYKTPPSATVRIADLSSEMNLKGIKILDFSAGRAYEGSPKRINEACAAALMSGDTHQTPAQGKADFRRNVALKLKRENNLIVDPDKNVMATLGCKNGLTLALMSIINPGDEVIVEDPCFVSYGATIGFFGGITVPVTIREKNNFRWTREDLDNAITDRTKCILLCSPQNPTGTVHTKKDLEIIADIAKENKLFVISDEIYERVTWADRNHFCIADLPNMKERSIGLMGFTKTLSMGGWRIGYMYAPENIISAAVVCQQHLMTCAGSFTQAGASFSLSEEYDKEVIDMWRDWEKRCKYVTDEINKIPKLSCKMPEGGFYAWINIKETGEWSNDYCERLLTDYHIALVPGNSFGQSGEGYVRMTCVKSWKDLQKGLELLSKGTK